MKKYILICYLIITSIFSKENLKLESEIIKGKSGKYDLVLVNNHKDIFFHPYLHLSWLNFDEMQKESRRITLSYKINSMEGKRINTRKGEIRIFPIDLIHILKYAIILNEQSASMENVKFKGKYEVTLDYFVDQIPLKTKPFFVIFKNHKDFRIQLK